MLLLILRLPLCLGLGLRPRCWCRSPVVPDWGWLATHVNHVVLRQAGTDGCGMCREALHVHRSSSMDTVHCCWCARPPGWQLVVFLIISCMVVAHGWHRRDRRDIWYITSHFKDGCLRLTEHWLGFRMVEYRCLMSYSLRLFMGRTH